MTAQGLINQYKAIDLQKIVNESLEENIPLMLSINKNQLWDGKNADGSDITPSYLDDPYFKTQKQAIVYANWKWRITPNPKRNKYTPNLFINGYAYSTFQIAMQGNKLMYDIWGAIVGKYPKIAGIMPGERHAKFMQVLRTTFFTKLRK